MRGKRVNKEDLTVAPCKEACPAGVDVPRYIRCIEESRFDEALAVIRERIPFPHVCGYACYHPCETKCANRQFRDPIAIRALKRFAAEHGGNLWRKNLDIRPSTGKQVGIIGSGPSGLTAAYFLATLGHKVTVFEAFRLSGGMMRVGIPKYRLPNEILDKEIDYIKEIGVDIKTDHLVESVDHLFEQGYDAIYLACGMQEAMRLGIPGDDAPGVQDGISFLKKVNLGDKLDIGDQIAVIGGGNTALDAVRSAIRLGCSEVSLFYRRSRDEMPASDEEIEAAIYEGVKIEFLTAPIHIKEKEGMLEVTFTRMDLGTQDSSGRPTPIPVEGSEFKRKFNTLIAAIGQRAILPRSMGLSLSDWGGIKADPASLSTEIPGVFAGGDIVRGPSSIIDAIADGRRAAISIDKYLGGIGIIDQKLAPPEEVIFVSDNSKRNGNRVQMPMLYSKNRIASFEPVERGLNEEQALEEAGRCLKCDARAFDVMVYGESCKECGYCMEVCGLNIFVPADSFNSKGYRPVEIKSSELCVGCLQCFYVCPDYAIDVKEIG